MNNQHNRIAEKILFIDDGMPKRVSVKKAEEVYGRKLDSRFLYAVAGDRVYCQKRQSTSCECCGAKKWADVFIPYEEPRAGKSRLTVLGVFKSSPLEKYTKVQIEKLTGLTKNSVVHAVNTLVDSTELNVHIPSKSATATHLFSLNEEYKPNVVNISRALIVNGLWA